MEDFENLRNPGDIYRYHDTPKGKPKVDPMIIMLLHRSINFIIDKSTSIFSNFKKKKIFKTALEKSMIYTIESEDSGNESFETKRQADSHKKLPGKRETRVSSIEFINREYTVYIHNVSYEITEEESEKVASESETEIKAHRKLKEPFLELISEVEATRDNFGRGVPSTDISFLPELYKKDGIHFVELDAGYNHEFVYFIYQGELHSDVSHAFILNQYKDPTPDTYLLFEGILHRDLSWLVDREIEKVSVVLRDLGLGEHINSRHFKEYCDYWNESYIEDILLRYEEDE